MKQTDDLIKTKTYCPTCSMECSVVANAEGQHYVPKAPTTEVSKKLWFDATSMSHFGSDKVKLFAEDVLQFIKLTGRADDGRHII